MAPEMAVGGPVDARTDVYLLGAALHRVLTGKSRHAGTTIRAAIYSAITSEPVEYPPSVPAALGAAANAATAPDPAHRTSTAAELRERISDYLRHKGSVALARSATERLGKLRSLAAEGPASGEAGARELDRVAAEASFALREALEAWPENPDALAATAELEALLEARRARAAELERLAGDLDPSVARRQRALAVFVRGL